MITKRRPFELMQPYKTEFLELALELGVLKFGEFKLKSGRISPYFFNAGLFSTGYAAAKLGRYYAALSSTCCLGLPTRVFPWWR
jgi:hypothetical protein